MNMLNQINQLDERFTQKFRISEQQSNLKKLSAFFAHSGDSWFDLAALFFIWLFTSGLLHKMTALMAGAVILLAILVLGVKFLIRRKRPEGQWGAIYRNTDPHSFPSGHAARTAMLAFLAFALGPVWLGIILSVWSVLVSLARVGLRVHYLSDVIAGIILGVLFGWLMAALAPVIYSFFPVIFA